jgi:hypothetical protein
MGLMRGLHSLHLPSLGAPARAFEPWGLPTRAGVGFFGAEARGLGEDGQVPGTGTESLNAVLQAVTNR